MLHRLRPLFALLLALCAASCLPCSHAKRLVFTAFGGVPERKANIEVWSRLYKPEDWDCVIFVFNTSLDLASLTGFAPHCKMYRKSGHVVVLYEFISPEFMARQNYSGVVFHSGDIAIDPHTYDPAVLFEFMDAHSLHVVSPLVPGSIWRPMSTPGLVPLGPPRSDVMYGRRTNFIEIGQLTAFDFIGWACWWSMLNTSINTIGFGYDRRAHWCFNSICGLRMGMLDSVNASHNVGDVHATQHTNEALRQEAKWKDLRAQTAFYPFSQPCAITPSLGPNECPAAAATLEVLQPLPRPGHRHPMPVPSRRQLARNNY